MAETFTPLPEEKSPPRSTWLDLVLYLLIGFVLFFLAGFVIGSRLKLGTLETSLVIYSLNVIFFVGSVMLVGIARGKITWRGLGFAPPRWKWSWLLLAFVVVLVFYPIRILMALAIQLILEGNLNSLLNSARMDLLVPSGFTWPSFLINLVMVGLAAPISEELFFRGAIFTWFREHYTLWPAVVASSLLFALGHIDTLAVVVTSFILGMVNALLYERYRSIWVPIAVHAVNNTLAILLVYASLGLGSFIR